jgi:protein O-GlcNAc transferase
MPSRDESLRQVRSSLSVGQLDAAARACARLLSSNPKDHEARYLQGRCWAAQGRWRDAAADFRRVLAVFPQHYPALIDVGIAQAFSGDYQDSMRALRLAQAIDSRPAELHFGLGMCALGTGDLAAAEQGFRAAVQRNPQLIDAHNNLGVVYDRLGRLQEAIACFRQAAQLAPAYARAQQNLGDALLRTGDANGASAAYRQVTELAPADAVGFSGLGAALLMAGDYSAAVTALKHSTQLDTQGFDAFANLGEALRNLSDIDGAGHAFEQSLLINPDAAEAHLGLGRVRLAQGREVEARTSLLAAARLMRQNGGAISTIARLLGDSGAAAEAMSLVEQSLPEQPASADLHEAQGDLLARAGRWSEAADAYERAVAFDPARPETLLSLGSTFESLGRINDAMDRVQRSLMLRPQSADAYSTLLSCAVRVCDWELAADSLVRLRSLPEGIEAVHPFVMLALELEPAEQAAVLRRCGRMLARQPAPLPQRHPVHERLRVAYLSPDIREHPVAHALAGVIEHHDRQRFDIVGVSLAAADQSDIGRRLRSGFEQFVDASASSVGEIANLLREREIDIAIDLAGHTAGARTAIFASHPATVQINYLGFPGSSGADFIDFIIADESVIATADEPFYSERVLRLPHCYLPFDASSPHPPAPSRAQAGLPEQGFVFCAFGSGYKISQRIFDLWMSLLVDLPDSVLWLRQMPDETRGRLSARAAACGVQAERLIFAPHVDDRTGHLARLGCADVFLDTLPYNAHTTALEVLWTGVPVISCEGRSFAGKVGASALRAAGLNELASNSLEQYRELALTLARSPERLKALRARLQQERTTSPAFDTARYTRDLEAVLTQAWQLGPRS